MGRGGIYMCLYIFTSSLLGVSKFCSRLLYLQFHLEYGCATFCCSKYWEFLAEQILEKSAIFSSNWLAVNSLGGHLFSSRNWLDLTGPISWPPFFWNCLGVHSFSRVVLSTLPWLEDHCKYLYICLLSLISK